MGSIDKGMFFLVGSVVLGFVTIRARVFPVALGWLLIVGGILNLVSGLTPAGLVTNILGVINLLSQAAAFAGYGWIIIRKSLQRPSAAQSTVDKPA